MTSVVREAARHTGLLKASRLLAAINQPSGFDCPVAPGPILLRGERTAFEFCENGAKAAIAEGTKKRVTPEFFAQWSIEQLLNQSDHWLEAQGD